jgi:4-hydroxybenzoate polyprenyltransferase
MSPKVRALIELARVSNLPTVWTNCIAGWVLGGGVFGIGLVPLLIGASLIYSAGMVLNDAFDFEWDRHHRPERPIPQGAIELRSAMGIGFGGLVAGALLFSLAGVAIYWTAALILAVLAYDKLHKQWLESVYLMGACRALLVISAASAGGDAFGALVLAWALAIGVYTVGITLVARGEAGDGPVGKIGLGLLAAPLIAVVFTQLKRVESSAMFGICVLLWLGWTIWVIAGMRKGTKEAKIAGVGHLIAGLVLIDAMAVAPSYGWLGITLAILFPSVLIAQRKISGS